MNIRYPAALALTLALAAGPAGARSGHKSRHRQPPVPQVQQLYSARALRRAKVILELKLLELRSEHLERVRRAIEQRIPIDELLKT